MVSVGGPLTHPSRPAHWHLNPPLHLNFDVSIKDGHHVTYGNPPARQPGLAESQLFRVPHLLHQACTLLVDGGQVGV